MGPPTAFIAAPADHRIVPVGESVGAVFSCTDAVNGPGIESCRDSRGSHSPSQLTTVHPGRFTYTVTAISRDGRSSTRSIHYTVAGAPRVSIQAPGRGASYIVGRAAPTRFSCSEGAFGPGIAACSDSLGSSTPGRLDTSHTGAFRYTVRAVSKDRQITVASVAYTVGPVPAVSFSRQGHLSRRGGLVRPGVRASCPSGHAWCAVSEQLTAHLHGRRMTVARLRQTIRPGHSTRLSVHLNRVGRLLLSYTKTLRARFTATGRVRGGKTTVFSRRLRLHGHLLRAGTYRGVTSQGQPMSLVVSTQPRACRHAGAPATPCVTQITTSGLASCTDGAYFWWRSTPETGLAIDQGDFSRSVAAHGASANGTRLTRTSRYLGALRRRWVTGTLDRSYSFANGAAPCATVVSFKASLKGYRGPRSPVRSGTYTGRSSQGDPVSVMVSDQPSRCLYADAVSVPCITAITTTGRAACPHGPPFRWSNFSVGGMAIRGSIFTWTFTGTGKTANGYPYRQTSHYAGSFSGTSVYGTLSSSYTFPTYKLKGKPEICSGTLSYHGIA